MRTNIKAILLVSCFVLIFGASSVQAIESPSGPPAGDCGNDTCDVDAGECVTCPQDCDIEKTDACCGNGECDEVIGENRSNCLEDCEEMACDCKKEEDCSPPCAEDEECVCDPNPGDGKAEGKCQLKCTGICFENPLSSCTLEQLIDAIINFIFLVSFAIAPLMLIIAGFYWFTAAGDEKKVDTAKKIILWTCAGLAIILFARGIVSVIKHILG